LTNARDKRSPGQWSSIQCGIASDLQENLSYGRARWKDLLTLLCLVHNTLARIIGSFVARIEITSERCPERVLAHALRYNNRLGVTGDFSGAYKNGGKFHTIMARPVFSIRKLERVTSFVHALVGVAIG
jgi:hypothetical protein